VSDRVLVVDDDAAIRRALQQRLQHWGYDASEAASGAEAIESVRRVEPVVVLLDLAMPGLSGFDVLKALRAEGATCDVVVLTAHGSVEAAVQAIREGATDFLQKPADFGVLQALLDRCAAGRRRDRVTAALSDRAEAAAVFGASPRMQALRETALRVADSNANVLVDGESGSGKQVLAELLHRHGPRRQGPFVHVNCVGLPENLAESALFGHEKGAFTGATSRQVGRVEMAADGTVFLDEIGDMTLALQQKLLIFLDSKTFERVGGTKRFEVDCRVVAATNRDLAAEVKAGRFRLDLYHRLNVIRLTVPPLRERREDVRPLAQAFLARFARETRRVGLTLSERAVAVLEACPWPGNVRQLKNVMERAAVLSPTEIVGPESLSPEVFAPFDGDPGSVRSDMPLKQALATFRREYVLRALAQANGNQTKASKVLGVQRSFLNRLLHRYGVVGSRSPAGTEPPEE
jgi:DNA-binding NtrC family response regulator